MFVPTACCLAPGPIKEDGMTQRARLREGWRYESAQDAAFALERLLKQHGIVIRSGSILERDILNVLSTIERKKTGDLRAENEDIRPYYRTMIGVYELATLILAGQDRPDFSSLIPHLKLLNEGPVLQNSRSSAADQSTNKIFELYMGAAALQCGTNLELDDPNSSRGNNPDVLVTLGTERWGIACKVLHGTSSEGFIGHLEKGLDQIERSPASVGIVAFNLKNVLRHDDIWPLAPMDGVDGNPLTPAAWNAFQAPFELLVKQVEEIGLGLVSYLPSDYFQRMFTGRKSVPAFLVWAASPSAVIINDHPTPCSVRVLNCQTLVTLTEAQVTAMKCLNWAIYAHSDSRNEMP